MVKIFVHGVEFSFKDLKACQASCLLQSFIQKTRCMFCFKKVPKECLNSNCQILSGKAVLKFVMRQPLKPKVEIKMRQVKKQAEGKENMCLKDNLTT